MIGTVPAEKTEATRVSCWSVFRFEVDAPSVVFVGIAWMVSARTVEVAGTSSVSPPYTAVIECCPTESEEVEKVTVSFAGNGSVTRVFAPSFRVTVPVGGAPDDLRRRHRGTLGSPRPAVAMSSR